MVAASELRLNWGNKSYGYTETTKRKGQDDPSDRLWRGNDHHSWGRNAGPFPAAARGTDRGCGYALAGYGEARTDAAGSPRPGDAGSRRHPVDPGADGLESGPNRSPARGHCEAQLRHIGIERPAVTEGPAGRAIPAQGGGSGLGQLKSTGQQRVDEPEGGGGGRPERLRAGEATA